MILLWLSEPGFGCIHDSNGNRCALGKLYVAVDDLDNFHSTRPHEFYKSCNKVTGLNDFGVEQDYANIYPRVRTNSSENHWKAVRYLLELLAQYPDQFELVGSKVSDIVKEKLSVEVV